MQDIIVSYLFKNKNCPLPSVGALCLTEGNASADFGNMKIEAPAAKILYSAEEVPVTDFVNYIAYKKNINKDEALLALKEFCRKIKYLHPGEKILLEAAGRFHKDSSGTLQFEQSDFPKAFAPDVFAQRVIHPNDSHQMLVGDTQTTTGKMTELLKDEISPTNRWWIWGILIFILAAAIILFYLNDANSNAAFGIAQPYNLA
ncbi:MAG: hypothetical protein JSU03_01330 [Bacteroidetes bacterium]|nr:hypothetical protein [Bacteroidota bacterium]MBS1755896.1 hypothetical protein [Bacteroidota bacterium]